MQTKAPARVIARDGRDWTEADWLAAELREVVRGEVRFDAGSRALYAEDASNYRQVPIGVVIPREIEDVVKTVEIARSHRAPILARGGGTSLAGQCCNVAVVLDFSKYLNRIVNLDPVAKTARVQPGIVLDRLRDAGERHHLTFAPDPATHSRNTLGGMIGNNSCGVHSIMGGKTDDNILSLEVLTYDGLRMEVGPTSEVELGAIVAAGGRRGEIYARLRDIRDRYGDLVRQRFPKIPRRVSGYNLDQLLPENGFNVARALVGTEGTCVTVLEATTQLVHSPPARSLVVIGYPNVFQAGDDVMNILSYGPIGLEGLDDYLVDNVRRRGLNPAAVARLPEGKGWLLVEFGGDTREESDEKARRMMEDLRRRSNPPVPSLCDEHDAQLMWHVRESGLGSTARVAGGNDSWEGWEDAAVDPAQLGPYLRDLRALVDKWGYRCALYGHFGHGCIHNRMDFDLTTAEGIKRFRGFVDEAADLVLQYGGSLSGEHGDGQSRAELYPKMFGPELVQAFREFKAAWDPDNKMNPGKVVDPYLITENLRLGTSYRPAQPPTHFRYPEDNGSLARAVLRCVGVGACRKTDAGTMCPSYMVTGEEMHSTRGRARLLNEMLQGEVITDGWDSEHVKEALDLCLACKACKGECPVNVDMATYKAEFLSHYYEHHPRPLAAYAFGFISVWARLAARAPALANLATQTPLLREIGKAVVGIAPQRRIPAFATETFVEWFKRRPSSRPSPHGGEGESEFGPPPNPLPGGETVVPSTQDSGLRTPDSRVILWPDTFNNYFYPQTAKAAVEVLEAAGFEVALPPKALCCGRPLYDYGMLDTAKNWLQEILDVLRPELEAGTPIVGLEPSCISVFRDELRNLFPANQDARRLAEQSFLLSELLVRKAPDFQYPKLARHVLVHGHCHHKSLMKMTAEQNVLTQMALTVSAPDAGCCGMAGAFGFEADHHGVAMAVGERRLLPAVRAADPDALIVADGFSCREQIVQSTGRHPLHLAEVIQLGLRQGPDGTPVHEIEQVYAPPRAWSVPSGRTLLMVGAAVAGAGVAVAIAGRRRR